MLPSSDKKTELLVKHRTTLINCPLSGCFLAAYSDLSWSKEESMAVCVYILVPGT